MPGTDACKRVFPAECKLVNYRRVSAPEEWTPSCPRTSRCELQMMVRRSSLQKRSEAAIVRLNAPKHKKIGVQNRRVKRSFRS
jgi:hypothetical protein